MSAKVDSEFYSEEEKKVIRAFGSVATVLSAVVNDGKGGFVLVGLALFFVDLIDFINIVTLYAFLDFAKPANLESIFENLENSLQISPFPIFDLQPPFADREELFVRPSIYARYGFSFNFLSNFVVFVLQTVAFLLLYKGLSELAKRLGQNKIARLLRGRFGPTAYSNGIEYYLSSSINIGFCAAASLVDARINCLYKFANSACAVVTVFVTGVVAVVHPVILRVIKRARDVDTNDCYMRALRRGEKSELFVLSKVLLGSVMALAIPLTPPLVALLLITAATVLKLALTAKSRFSSRWMKLSKILYVVFHLMLNITLLAIYASNFNR